MCVSLPKLTSNCRDTYSPLFASQDAETNCTKEKVIRAKKCPKSTLGKSVAAVCGHFSSKAHLIYVVSRCNNPEICILQHSLHVIPARCAWKRNCLENSHFVLFNVLRRHNDSSDKQQNEECKLLRNMPDAVPPRQILRKKKAAMKIRYGGGGMKTHIEEKSASTDSPPFLNCEYILQYVLLISSLNDLFIWKTAAPLLADMHLTHAEGERLRG